MQNLLEPEEVAEKLRRSLSWLYKYHTKLSKEKGFPKPVKINGYNLQWSAPDVDMWFNTHINTTSRTNDNIVGCSYEKLLAANASLLGV